MDQKQVEMNQHKGRNLDLLMRMVMKSNNGDYEVDRV